MPKTLVVKDDPELRRLLQRELSASGYEVVAAEDGETGLRLHVGVAPDLVILDWMLPGIDGLDVLKTLRRTATTPVLMLTARGEEVDRVIGLDLGADDYVPKPFGVRELLARVRALLRRAELVRATMRSDREGHTELLTCGEFTLDPSAHVATLNGDGLSLRQKCEVCHRHPVGSTPSPDCQVQKLMGGRFGLVFSHQLRRERHAPLLDRRHPVLELRGAPFGAPRGIFRVKPAASSSGGKALCFLRTNVVPYVIAYGGVQGLLHAAGYLGFPEAMVTPFVGVVGLVYLLSVGRLVASILGNFRELGIPGKTMMPQK